MTDVDSLSKEERREYDRALKAYRDTVGAFKGERMLGIKEGEKKKQFEIARNLKSMGMTIDIIRQATGLTDEEINAL